MKNGGIAKSKGVATEALNLSIDFFFTGRKRESGGGR